MILAILAFLVVTFLFGCLGICIAKEVEGRQKVWPLLFTFAGWASIVIYAVRLAGLWGKPIDTSAPIPDWFMIPFCLLFFSLPITFPFGLGIYEIWQEGGENPEFALPMFEGEGFIGFLFAVSLGLSFYMTDRFGINYGWGFPISLPILLLLIFIMAGFAFSLGWLATQLARRFSPAAKRAKRPKSK